MAPAVLERKFSGWRLRRRKRNGVSLADVLYKVFRTGERPLEEVVRLGLNERVERRYLVQLAPAAEMAVQQTADVAEAGAVRREHEALRPAHELARHRQHGTIGVRRALLFEEVDGGVERVEDHDALAEDGDGGDVA